jgi:hypothetical protein
METPDSFIVTPPPGQTPPTAQSAVTMARQQNAPLFGYLQKRGTNIPAFKRRFFVLQPGTVLYYFLAPTDTEPRGCLDLEGSWIESEENDPNRFSICWEGGRKVILEARSSDLAEQWKEGLQHERLSVCKAALAKEKRHNSALQSRVKELEAALRDLKLVEQDRDGALEDAAMWKERFHQLDESLKMLTGQLRRSVLKESDGIQNESGDNGGTGVTGKDLVEITGGLDEEKKEDGSLLKAVAVDKNESIQRNQSLLDDDAGNEIDFSHVPGEHFISLQNTCDQLVENHRLASLEASTAVEDLNGANERLVEMEKRMAKAEKHLCKLWEENCALRKSVKQKKKEKAVLVREVKVLIEATKAHENERKFPRYANATQNDDPSEIEEEEKLINELEERILSSIRMHEQFLTSNSITKSATASEKPSEIKQMTTFDFSLQQLVPQQTPQSGPLQKNLLSLFDESSEDSNIENDLDHADHLSLQGEGDEGEADIPFENPYLKGNLSKSSSCHSLNQSPNRRHPIELLDRDEDDSFFQEDLITSLGATPSFPSHITDGKATSNLKCPLVDVVTTAADRSSKVRADEGSIVGSATDDLQVYHLTFYSRRIGLQFQKVPPPPLKAKGVLTAAITADLSGVVKGGEKTAAELRRVAAFSKSDEGEPSEPAGQCPIATPVDAVLVCGFDGFDDSGSNPRPKLGARLVAFDGVSVEVGNWTFDSIRKSIQARGRPLTLTFRNDFLTTEQRQILTKAAKETELRASLQPTTSALKLDHRQSYTHTPSARSVHSYGSEPVPFTSGLITPYNYNDDQSLSATSGSGNQYSVAPHSFSASRSVSSGGYGARSFSEAGSSVSVLSAVAPLVSNLLRRKEPFTPDYLHREPEAVEDTPQHQDFKSELL